MYRLLSVGTDAKSVKSIAKGYLQGICYLEPSAKLCPCCSAGCRKACLFSAGRGQMTCVQRARRRKTMLYNQSPQVFKEILIKDIETLVKQAKKRKLTPCVRINGTSDIDVQLVFGDVIQRFNNVQFLDYTKDLSRRSQYPNYYICYSRSERTTVADVKWLVAHDFTVAVVFDKLPRTWYGMKVIDGDKSDLRFLDPPGVLVGLRAKGKAKKDTTGFVVRTKGDLKDDTVHMDRGSTC